MIRIEDISGISCKGIRDNNEDYIIYDKNARIIVLCDGMGGHGHGEIASKTVAQTVYERLSLTSNREELTKYDFQEALEEAVCKLNEVDVYGDEKKMGTTLVVVAINKYELLVGHVGDSRFYQFNEEGIRDFRTRDHSKVAEAVEAEILTEEEASKSSYKNLLTRCVMAGKVAPDIEVDAIPISGKKRIVLCSDGLVDAVSDNELQEILIGRQIDNALSLLNDKCIENSKDNYSIIIADLIQPEIISSNNPSTYSPNNESDEIIICENCGNRNNKQASFCSSCGKELSKSPSPCTKTSIKDKINNEINSNPIIKHVLYALVAIFAIYVCISIYTHICNNTEENEDGVNIEVKHDTKKEDCYLIRYRKNIYNFIEIQCKIDSIKKDSFMSKTEFIEKYKKFEKQVYKELNDDLSNMQNRECE